MVKKLGGEVKEKVSGKKHIEMTKDVVNKPISKPIKIFVRPRKPQGWMKKSNSALVYRKV